MSAYLVHHGIKGQQWGVTHGPPYPISDNGETRIKKGSKVYRLSARNETLSKGHAYVNVLKSDAKHYKGFFGLRLRAGPIKWHKKVYEYQYAANKDLLSPSKRHRVETFLSMYNDDPIIKEELQMYYDKKVNSRRKKGLLGDSYTKDSKIDDLSDDQKYDIFSRSLGDDNPYIRNEYFKKLAREGYSFVIDDLDAGRFGKNPSIIFERDRDLIETGKKEVSRIESIKIALNEGASI